jgi:mannose-6-phosphate isomerase-like protein (cupin superfamily)
MGNVNLYGDMTVNESQPKEPMLVINPEIADEFEAPEPYQRFMKILVDNEVFKDAPLCMTLVTYPPDAKCSPHSHGEAVEIYFVLEGSLTATVQGKPYHIEKSQLIYISHGKEHYAENRENRVCRFLAIHVPGVSDVAQVKREWTKVGKESKKEGGPYA